MAQADGVVANGTGSAVRSDINTQYAALWSNHSGSTEPSSGKVAYQTWADTNSGYLKIRNAANNAWIQLFKLDGTDICRLTGSTNNTVCTVTGANAIQGESNVRIDSNGRLLVGATSANAIHNQNANLGGDSTTPLIYAEGTGDSKSLTIVSDNTNAWRGSVLGLGRTRGTSVGDNTIVADGDNVGQIVFPAADGTNIRHNCASIRADIDGTPGENDVPGRLVFSTTADGAALTTERMRIDKTGDVTISDGDLVIGTSGHGIDFSAQTSTTTTGSSPASELLAHYELGTWTPTFHAATTTGTFTPGNTQGRYTRVGNLVHVVYYSSAINQSGFSGDAYIDGLPFTVMNTGFNYNPVVFAYTTAFASAPQAYASNNSTRLTITAANSTSSVAWSNTNSTYLMFSVVYQTDF